MMISLFKFFLYTVEVVVSLLLLVAILIQRTRSQGMGLAIGGGMGEQMFGSQVGNVLTRATVIMAIIFLGNTTLLAMMGSRQESRSVVDTLAPAVPAMPASAPAASPGPAPMGGVGGNQEFAPLAPVGPSGVQGDVPVESAMPPSASAPVAEPSAPAEQFQVTVPAAGSVPVAEPVAVPAAAP